MVELIKSGWMKWNALEANMESKNVRTELGVYTIAATQKMFQSAVVVLPLSQYLKLE